MVMLNLDYQELQLVFKQGRKQYRYNSLILIDIFVMGKALKIL